MKMADSASKNTGTDEILPTTNPFISVYSYKHSGKTVKREPADVWSTHKSFLLSFSPFICPSPFHLHCSVLFRPHHLSHLPPYFSISRRQPASLNSCPTLTHQRSIVLPHLTNARKDKNTHQRETFHLLVVLSC